MATRDTNGPSTYTIPLQASEGLPSLRPGTNAAPGAHVLPYGVTHAREEYPALRQDFDFVDPPHAPLASAFDVDAFIASFDFTDAGNFDDSNSPPQKATAQSWANNLEADPGPVRQSVTQLTGKKRTISLSLPSDIVNKVCISVRTEEASLMLFIIAAKKHPQVIHISNRTASIIILWPSSGPTCDITTVPTCLAYQCSFARVTINALNHDRRGSETQAQPTMCIPESSGKTGFALYMYSSPSYYGICCPNAFNP